MMTKTISLRAPRRCAGVALAALTCGLAAIATAPPAAAQFSDRVKNACRSDFKRFCPKYKLDSPALRQCMRSVEDNISQRCYDALLQSGEKSRSRRRR